MRKMMLYGKKYGAADPQLVEGDVFRWVISVPEFDRLAVESQNNGSVRMGDKKKRD